MEQYVRYVCGIGFPIAGLIVGGVVWWYWRQGKASLQWPSTTGEIQESGTRFNGEWHLAEVRYRYNVNGREYSGHRIHFGSISGAKVEAETDVVRYPRGASVAVYYNPKSPRVSTLETGAPWNLQWIMTLVISVIFIITGLVFLVWGGDW